MSTDGVYLIDKPEGITSFDVLRKFKSIGIKDVGHGGTLDPFATGLLMVFSGRALKLSEYFLKSEKAYEATLAFGKTTESGDLTNPVTETSAVIPNLSLEEMNLQAERFSSVPYLQIPPMHSAKKVDGKKLYELARQGKTIEREAVSCILKNFNIKKFDPAQGIATFSVTVSSGTYIRTLAQDFARELGTVGMLTTLRRLRSGIFSIKNAISLDQLTANSPFITCELISQQIFPVIECDEKTYSMLVKGQQEKLFQQLELDISKVSPDKKNIALFFESKLCGIVSKSEHGWKISKVFITSE
ncbi:MAG: tRNA pseudouridine(55) synthase TruB [Xanthomonadaceae bacterium]|nr:tRNA pseudouridine(55) synthase TruB [Xanthomonadaceae bacterium]